MATEVRWSPLARDDLKQAANHIAEDFSVYADAFIADVLKKASTLALFPRSGHVVPELGNSNFREVPIRNYRLIYRVSTDGVLILGVIHGARDLERIWRSENRDR